MMRNASIEVGAVGRDAIYNPASVSGTIQDAIEVISDWTVPGRIMEPGRYSLAIAISLKEGSGRLSDIPLQL
jgi:hypothetical protein